jgi:hypothetical protein
LSLVGSTNIAGVILALGVSLDVAQIEPGGFEVLLGIEFAWSKKCVDAGSALSPKTISERA